VRLFPKNRIVFFAVDSAACSPFSACVFSGFELQALRKEIIPRRMSKATPLNLDFIVTGLTFPDSKEIFVFYTIEDPLVDQMLPFVEPRILGCCNFVFFARIPK
jgi:hypothetical protein